MTDTDAQLTLAIILTAAGAVGASALVTGIVQLVKTLFPKVSEGIERQLAFVVSAALVTVAYISGIQDGSITVSIATLFAAFMAWYGIARLAMAHYSDATGEINSLRGPEENRPGGGD